MKKLFVLMVFSLIVLVACNEQVDQKDEMVNATLDVQVEKNWVSSNAPSNMHIVADFSITNRSNIPVKMGEVIVYIAATDIRNSGWRQRANLWLEGGSDFPCLLGDSVSGYFTLGLEDHFLERYETQHVRAVMDTREAATGDTIQVVFVSAKLSSWDDKFITWKEELTFAPLVTLQHPAQVQTSRKANSPKYSFYLDPQFPFLKFEVSNLGVEPIIIDQFTITLDGMNGGSIWMNGPKLVRIHDANGEEIGNKLGFVQSLGSPHPIDIPCYWNKPILFPGDIQSFDVRINENPTPFQIGDIVRANLVGLSLSNLQNIAIGNYAQNVQGHSLQYIGLVPVDVRRTINTPSISTPKTNDSVMVFTVTNHNASAMIVQEMKMTFTCTDSAQTLWHHNNVMTIKNDNGQVWMGPVPLFVGFPMSLPDDFVVQSHETVTLYVTVDTSNIALNDTVMVSIDEVLAIDMVSGETCSALVNLGGEVVHYNATPLQITLAAGTPAGATISGNSEVLHFIVHNPNPFPVDAQEFLFEVQATDNVQSGWNQYPNVAKIDFSLYESSNLGQSLDTQDNDWNLFTELGEGMYVLNGLPVQYAHLSLNGLIIPAQSGVTFVLKMDTTGISSMDDDTLRINIRGIVSHTGNQMLKQVVQVLGGILNY